jgi:hypothetical protein
VPAAGKELDAIREVMAQNRGAALNVSTRMGRARLQQLLLRADRDLQSRLKKAEGLRGPGKCSFTAQQMRVTLAQVRDVTRTLQKGVKGVLVDGAGSVADNAAGHVLDYLYAADRQFRGMGKRRLQLDEAAILDSATEGARTSVLRRLASSGEPMEGADAEPHRAKAGILDRYGMNVVGSFEQSMQLGLVSGRSWAEMRDGLTEASPFLQGAPAHWAERILRTETMGVYGRSQWEGIRAADEQLGDMVKILSCGDDARTGADSLDCHGEIRMPDEAFASWHGLFMHPPDRPNDRAVVVPHRIAWPIPPSLHQKPTAYVQARWVSEGHKRAMPPRSLYTTVPLSKFGASTR